MKLNQEQVLPQVHRFQGFSPRREVLPATLRFADGPTPVFGDSKWNLSAMGLSPSQKNTLANFDFTTLPTAWRGYGQVFIMTLLNPSDKTLIESKIYLNHWVPKLKTLNNHFTAFRRFTNWVETNHKPRDLMAWKQGDLDEYYAWLSQNFAPSQRFTAERMFQALERVSPALPSFFLFDVPESTARRSSEIKTKPINPEDFWALIHACWAYIDVYSQDIFAAREELREQVRKSEEAPIADGHNVIPELIEQYFMEPDAFIPVHVSDRGPGNFGEINWAGLELLLPFRAPRGPGIVNTTTKARVQKVWEALENGVPKRYGTISRTPRLVEDAQGSSVPWCLGFDRIQVRFELTKLRTACFIFVSALSMMRLSEVAGLEKGAVVTHYGAPALKAKVYKKRVASGETAYWWISPPVVQAIKVVERISENDGLLFRSVRKGTNKMDYSDEVRRFVQWINEIGASRGLASIKDSDISMHRMRRTMAIITAAQPDGEIALGLTLKHNSTRALANSVTSGYAAPTIEWEQELKLQQRSATAAELVSQWSKREKGQLKLGGPGALEYENLMRSTNSKPIQRPKVGDKRLIRNLLRDPQSRVTFGSLNHCLGDASKAKCLEGLPDDAKNDGPILADCSPSICRNSVITSEHLPIWESEEDELVTLLKDRRMSDFHRHQLEHRLKIVQSVTKSPGFRP